MIFNLIDLFKLQENQDEKLLKNIKKYEQEKRKKQNEISTSKRNKSDRQKTKKI